MLSRSPFQIKETNEEEEVERKNLLISKISQEFAQITIFFCKKIVPNTMKRCGRSREELELTLRSNGLCLKS